MIAAIEARISEWTRVPPDHGEPIQVLRYQNGQKYDAHWVSEQLSQSLTLKGLVFPGTEG